MKRVLLIERDPDFALCLKHILEADGFEVEWTETIADAIASLETLQPSLSIIGLEDGEKFSLDDITCLTSSASNSAVLVTANFKTPELISLALSAGADDFLLKPFGTREILERTRSLTEPGSQTNPARNINGIAGNIHLACSIDDILRLTLDQLAHTLHLTDSLIALGTNLSFTVLASKGYKPDPTSRIINLSGESCKILLESCSTSQVLTTDVAAEIIKSAGITTHRAFPSVMPLSVHSNGDAGKLIGFIMGHGPLILDDTDILEMELYLSQVARDLSVLTGDGSPFSLLDEKIHEGEFSIPETGREEICLKILDAVARYFTAEHDEFWLRLVLDEAINNAIQHGHNEPIAHPVTPVKIAFSISSRRLSITVEDTGQGFDFNNVPNPTAEENLMSVNGRGIFLMRMVMDEVVFNERGNSVTMVKDLDGKPLGPFPADEYIIEFC